jgi:adenylate cyclase
VALIPPVLPAVAAARLGYNNGYTDADGVLRRYRYVQSLPDGSQIQSLAVSVARTVAPDLVAASAYSTGILASFSSQKDPLMVWRSKANSYPRISLADLFTQAEGGQPKRSVPSLAGKVVLIGATASSLHDIHPTPLSPLHAGVDSLATALDNAINGHHLAELPTWLQALLAVLLVLGMAAWVLRNGVSSLDAALLLLPAALLAVSYLSLNVGGLFLDLHLAAGVALLFIALLKTWNGWRRNHWCGDLAASATTTQLALLPLRSAVPLADTGLDQLIRLLELHAPQCRVMGGDATATWPARLRWPQLLHRACIMGPAAQLAALPEQLGEHALGLSLGNIHPISAEADPHRIAQTALQLMAEQAH